MDRQTEVALAVLTTGMDRSEAQRVLLALTHRLGWIDARSYAIQLRAAEPFMEVIATVNRAIMDDVNNPRSGR